MVKIPVTNKLMNIASKTLLMKSEGESTNNLPTNIIVCQVKNIENKACNIFFIIAMFLTSYI